MGERVRIDRPNDQTEGRLAVVRPQKVQDALAFEAVARDAVAVSCRLPVIHDDEEPGASESVGG